MTDRWFEAGNEFALVRTGRPQHQVEIGVGATAHEAIDNLETTPIQCEGSDSGVQSALEWAQNEGWDLETDDDGDFIEVKRPADPGEKVEDDDDEEADAY